MTSFEVAANGPSPLICSILFCWMAAPSTYVAPIPSFWGTRTSACLKESTLSPTQSEHFGWDFLCPTAPAWTQGLAVPAATHTSGFQATSINPLTFS